MVGSIEPPASSASLTQSDSPAVPPLRIHHMLVATAVTAVVMSFVTVLKREGSSVLAQATTSPMATTQMICASLALTTIGFGFYWRRLGIPFFHQPGHWLLVLQAMSASVVAVSMVVLLAGPSEDQFAYVAILVLWYIGLGAVAVLIDLWAAARVADTSWWRLLFVLKAGVTIAMFVAPRIFPPSSALTHLLYLTTYALVVTVSIAAAINDQFTRRNRDWPHWLGVWMNVGLAALVVVSQTITSLMLALQ